MGSVQTERHPFFPRRDGVEVQAQKPRRSIFRSAWFWLCIALVVVVLVVRIAADPIAAGFTQRTLDRLSGYEGTFASTHVSFFPPGYSIHELRLVQDGMKKDEALAYIETLDAQLDWKDLFRGRLEGGAVAQHAKFTFKLGETKLPPEVKEAMDRGAEKLKRDDFDFSKTLDELIPFRLNRFAVRDSEAVLIDGTDAKRPSFWLNDIEFVVENLVTREKLDENVPMLMAGRARVAKTGTLTMFFVVDPLEEKPAITGQTQIAGLQLDSLFEWAKAKAGVSPHGTLFMGVNMNTLKTKLASDVELIAWDVKVDGLDDSLINDLKAGAANIAFKVLAEDDENRRASVRLPLSVDLKNVHPKVWPTVLSVVGDSFVDAVDFGFGALPKLELKRAGNYARDEDRLVVSKNTAEVFKADGLREVQQKLNGRIGQTQEKLKEDGVAPAHEIDANGELTSATQRSLAAFQRAERLTITGLPDYATVKRLGVDPSHVFQREPPARTK